MKTPRFWKIREHLQSYGRWQTSGHIPTFLNLHLCSLDSTLMSAESQAGIMICSPGLFKLFLVAGWSLRPNCPIFLLIAAEDKTDPLWSSIPPSFQRRNSLPEGQTSLTGQWETGVPQLTEAPSPWFSRQKEAHQLRVMAASWKYTRIESSGCSTWISGMWEANMSERQLLAGRRIA